MNNLIKLFCLLSVFLLSGCACLDFGDDKGLTYFDPKPYLFVTTTKECVTTATIIVIPGSKKEVKFKSGYGSAELSVNLSNGMITSVNQKTDTKIPDTISSIASLGTVAASFTKATVTRGKQVICTPTATLYPVENGVPNIKYPVSFPVSKELVDIGDSK